MINANGLTLFTCDAHRWSMRLQHSPADAPIAVIPLAAPSRQARDSMLDLLEIGPCGAVLVRPDGHVVWRSRFGSDTADQLCRFLERQWSGVFLADRTAP